MAATATATATRAADADRSRWVLPAVAATIGFLLDVWLGLARFASGLSGNYDLGLFTQSAQGWAALRGPTSAIKGFDLLGDHFSPITVLFGVGYRVWPDPRSLIVVQSLTLALTVWLVVRYAVDILPPARGTVVAVVGVLAPPLIGAASFDVHETGLGAPLVAALAIAVARLRYRPALLLAVGVLLVKEDTGLLVAACALPWWVWTRDIRRSLSFVAVGVGGFLLANAVIVAVNPAHTSPYLHYLATGDAQAPTLLGRWTPVVLFAAACGLALLDPLCALAVPTLAWRLLADNPYYWSDKLHYDALIGPVAFIVLARALRPDGGWRRWAAGAVALATVIPGVTRIADIGPWKQGPFGRSADMVAARRLVTAQVPPHAAVVADQLLGTDLVTRNTVRMLGVGAPGRYVLLLTDRDSLYATRAAKQSYVAAAQASGARVTSDGAVTLVDLGETRPVTLPG